MHYGDKGTEDILRIQIIRRLFSAKNENKLQVIDNQTNKKDKKMELKEGDIPKINAILSEATSGYVLADVATLKKLGMSKDEFAYYQQIIVSCDLGEFRKDGYHSLGPNYNTAVALRDDWVKGMFDRQEEDKKTAALENRRLRLEVRNGEWEKWRYWITTLIAVAALIVSLCSFRAKF